MAVKKISGRAEARGRANRPENQPSSRVAGIVPAGGPP